MIDVFARAIKGKKPNRFWVYWGAFHNQESQAEKKIMGDEYDTAALGKEPPEKRIYWFPHGAPDENIIWLH